MFEALLNNTHFNHKPAPGVIARIGPKGVQWNANAEYGDLTNELDNLEMADPLTEAKRVKLMSRLREEKERLDLLQDQQRILEKIAAQRGPGTLHNDLKLP